MHGELFFRCRGFRTIVQLALEGLVGFMLFFAWLAALAAYLLAIPIALALTYIFYRMRTGWHRKVIEVWSSGLVIGKEHIPWEAVKGIEVVGNRVEAGLIIGQTALSYEEVVEVEVSLADRRHRFRLKRRDFERFAEAVERANPSPAGGG